MTPVWRKHTAHAVLIALTIVFTAIMLFGLLPLKPWMHADEMERFAYPGFLRGWGSVTEALQSPFDWIDNGRTLHWIFWSLRPFSSNPDFLVAAYKTLISVLMLLGVYFTSRTIFTARGRSAAVSLTTGFAFSIAALLQSNEVMTEPICLALFLFWLPIFLSRVFEKTLRQEPLEWVICFALPVFILYASFQFFLFLIGTAGLSALLLVRGASRRALRNLVIIGLGCGIAFALYLWTGGGGRRTFVWNYASAIQVFSAFDVGTDTWLQRYSFGLRTFFWMHFTPILLTPVALYGIYRLIRPVQLWPSFFAVFTLLALVSSAVAYRGALHPRYFFLSNCFLTIWFWAGLYVAAQDAYRRLPRGAFAVLAGLAAALFITDSIDLMKRLPSFASTLSFPMYSDRADYHLSRTGFGLIPRTALVTPPYRSALLYYPNKIPGQTNDGIFILSEKISEHLPEDTRPVYAVENPNYFMNGVLALLYFRRFGHWPPNSERAPRCLVAVWLPPTSSQISVAYAGFENKSEAGSLRNLTNARAQAGAEVLFHERTPEYGLEMIRIP